MTITLTSNQQQHLQVILCNNIECLVDNWESLEDPSVDEVKDRLYEVEQIIESCKMLETLGFVPNGGAMGYIWMDYNEGTLEAQQQELKKVLEEVQ